MSESHTNSTDCQSRGNLPNEESVFDEEPDSTCSLPPGGDAEQVDMYAMYEYIGKLRGAFQKNITSRHPWFPVLEELVRTEDQYLSDINSIVTGYVPVFRTMETELPSIITPSTTGSIFINLEEIRDFHYEFNQLLRPTLGQSSLTGVGQLFQDQADRFKIYSDYCSNHSKSVELLVKLSKHKAVGVCLRSVQTKMQHPLNLSAYLLKPVQRVLKYKLLLESLLKHTEKESDEQALLMMARKRMDSIAKEINELTAVSECKQLLEEIQEGLDQTPFEGCLTDYGNIQLQDTMLDLKAARSRQERLVLLLDRAMLVCKVRDKPKKGGTGKGLRAKRNAPYKFKDFIMITELTFTQDDHFRLDDKAFLVHKQASKLMTTYCLKAPSLVKKNHWVSTLQDQVVASFNFEPDLLQQIMDTLKRSTQSLNINSEENPMGKRSLTKYKHLISVSPSTQTLIGSKDSFDSEDEKRPFSMYDCSVMYSSVPSHRNGVAEEIYCERVEQTGEERGRLREQVRKYSHSVEKKPRSKLATPVQAPAVLPDAKERDSGVSDSQEYSNAEVKQQMRDLLCTMQQDYATFHVSSRERDSGVEGDAPAQLDYLSLKRKHEGLVSSLINNYMSAVSQHNQKSMPGPLPRDSPRLGNKLNLSDISNDSKLQTQANLLATLSDSSDRSPKSPHPPLSQKPSLPPRPPGIHKAYASGFRKKSGTLPRSQGSSLFNGDKRELCQKTSSGSNTSPLSPFEPPSPGKQAGGNKVLGMKNHWEKTINTHKEECKKL